MTEKEYLKQLNKRLKPLKEQDKQAIIDFYKEMIADKKENGKSEEEAIGELEGADVVAERTLQEYGVDASRKRKLPPMSAATWVLLIVGSPLWFGLAVAVVCIAITAPVVPCTSSLPEKFFGNTSFTLCFFVSQPTAVRDFGY